AVGTPEVVIWGPANLSMARPVAPRDRCVVLIKDLVCRAGCPEIRCVNRTPMQCLTDIGTGQVVEAADRLLGREALAPSGRRPPPVLMAMNLVCWLAATVVLALACPDAACVVQGVVQDGGPGAFASLEAPRLSPPAGRVITVSTVDELTRLLNGRARGAETLTSDVTVVLKPGTYDVRAPLQVGKARGAGSPLTHVTIRGATDDRNAL